MQALSQLLSTFVDSVFSIIGAADSTKKLKFDASAQGTGVTTTIGVGAQTGNHAVALPVLAGNDTFALDGAANLFAQVQTVDLGMASGSLPATVVAGTALRLGTLNGSACFIEGTSFGSSGMFINGVAAGGTRASPAALPAETFISGFQGFGYDGGSVVAQATGICAIQADGLWSASNHGAYFSWRSTPNGSTTRADWMRLRGGNLSIGSVATMAGTGGLTVGGTTASTSPTTGALQVAGGAAVVGDIHTSGSVSIEAPAGATLNFSSSGGSHTGAAVQLTTTGELDVLGVGQGLVLQDGTASIAVSFGNYSFGNPGYTFGSEQGVIYIKNCTTPPSTPTAGGIFYVDSGALKYRGSSGTISTVAPA